MTALSSARQGAHTAPRQELRRTISEQRKILAPTKQQEARAKRAADMLVESITREAAGHRDKITGVEIGGSYRKGTWLASPEMDIDVYVRFNPDVPPKRFKSTAIKVGLAALRGHSPYLRYSDHPYVEAKIGRGMLANIVPCYDIQDQGQWRSAADRSRFHTEYMDTALTDPMRSDVRLLKVFLKACGLYGAQIARNGFSGYVSEVLVAHYGSFEKVVTEFAAMTPGTVIGQAAKNFGSIVSIMDPIDKNRNLAAAISDQNMVRFIMACRSLIAKPSADFFNPGRTGAKGRRGAAPSYWGSMLTIRFGFKSRAPDIIWGQTKKSAAKIAKYLEDGGFGILRQGVHADTDSCIAYIFFLLESVKIPPGYVQRGPEFTRQASLDTYVNHAMTGSVDSRRAFMVWVDADGRISALKRRQDTAADAHARRILKKKQMLPPDIRGAPVVWVGKGELAGANDRATRAAREAAGKLVCSDVSIIHLT